MKKDICSFCNKPKETNYCLCIESVIAIKETFAEVIRNVSPEELKQTLRKIKQEDEQLSL